MVDGMGYLTVLHWQQMLFRLNDMMIMYSGLEIMGKESVMASFKVLSKQEGLKSPW
jgi:hypothetical protein